MEEARASLERGVRALFADPSAVLAASTRHPLCECALQQAPPLDWRYLQRFPVLKRQVLMEFRVVAEEMAKMPQTPRKRRKRSALQQRDDTQEYRAVCLASLCQIMAQCELLTLREEELMQRIGDLETLDVLRRVIGGRLLPLRQRLLLLGFVLQNQQEKCLETAVQSWIQELCEKILEETLEATANGGTLGRAQKRVRTRSGDKYIANVHQTENICGFCREGASAESLRSSGGWRFLVESTHRTAQMMEDAGESYITNKAMNALSAFWDSLPVAGGVLMVKVGRRRKRVEISVEKEVGIESSISLVAYERICQTIIESLPKPKNSDGVSSDKVSTARKMWLRVWERELKNVVKTKQVTLGDAIRHCSKADAFASAQQQQQEHVARLLGYRVVSEVIRSLGVSTPGSVTAFGHVWSGTAGSCSEPFSRISIPSSVGASSTKHILRSYLTELLRCPPSLRKNESSSCTNEFMAPGQVTMLEVLSILHEIFVDSVSGAQQGDYTKYWDALLTQVNGEESSTDHEQIGIKWCLMLENCVQALNGETAVPSCHETSFLHAFKSYCLSIMYGAIASGGESITSGGAVQHQLISMESDCSTVRRILALMMTTFGESWVSKLIAQLVQENTSLRLTGELNPRGMSNLLFPALVSSTKTNNRFDQRRQKTGQQQFIETVRAVNSQLKSSEATSLYLVSLMHFCGQWDGYQSTHMKEPPTRANRWGFKAMIELDMLPELLECYERDAVVCQESSEALRFAAEVLQNASNCPPTLEASLYKVLSIVKAGAEHAKNLISSPPALEKQLVSHSNEILQRLLHAVKSTDQDQTRFLLEQLKNAPGTLNELRKQLERWFSFVEVHGAAFAGKESRLELSLLCTRLIRWFPDEFGSMRYLLMTPLDSHLVFALKAFVKEAGRLNNALEPESVVNSASPLPSAVRVEMALHLYLSAAGFPDLETLTVLLTKALVKCRSRDAYNHLLMVAQKNTRVLMSDAAVATLSSPLRGLEFSSSTPAYQDDDDDGETQMQHYARRAKSIIYQENTLRLLSLSSTIFEGGISWSTKLFDEQSAVTWLPHFFEYILKTEFGKGALRADLLLASLENLSWTRGDLAENLLQGSYWLAALLNTALIACSSRSAGASSRMDADINARLQTITRKVLEVVSIFPSKATHQTDNVEADSVTQPDGVLGLLNMSKCAWVVVEDKRGRLSGERLLGDNRVSALRMSISGAWNASAASRLGKVPEPAVQLFLPFTHWLSGALVYSQSFLEEPSTIMRCWERTFASYVADLYLHLQFENDSCSLLESWLSTWITSNIVRGQEDMQLLALLPSQVALFRRLGMRPYRGYPSRGQAQDSTSIWKLVFVAINIAVDQSTSENPAEIEQATELIVSTLTTLDIVDLSALVDFAQFSQMQDVEPFFEKLNRLLSRPQLHICSVTQICCLLQFPLELLVCWYACKISAELEEESQQFLQCVKNVLHGNFTTRTGELANDSKAIAVEGEGGSHKPFAVDSAEMEAFWQFWADEMLLKYDYLDRGRCSTVLGVIQMALQGGNDTAQQSRSKIIDLT